MVDSAIARDGGPVCELTSCTADEEAPHRAQIEAAAAPDDHHLEQRFLCSVRSVAFNGLSETLLSDLAELAAARIACRSSKTGGTQSLTVQLEADFAVRESDVLLVERRERLRSGDLRAATTVHLLHALLRDALVEVQSTSEGQSLRVVLARRIAAAQSVFSY